MRVAAVWCRGRNLGSTRAGGGDADQVQSTHRNRPALRLNGRRLLERLQRMHEVVWQADL